MPQDTSLARGHPGRSTGWRDPDRKLAKNLQKPITVEQAEKLARELRAVKYVECSALTQKGLKNVFDEAILAALEPPEQPKKKKGGLL